MKKIILGLFLILGALSFASPSFVDVNKIKQNSYEIRDDEDDFFTFVKSTDEAGISVAFNVIEDTNSKEVSEMIKSIKRAAFGYSNFSNFKKRVLVQVGIIPISA